LYRLEQHYEYIERKILDLKRKKYPVFLFCAQMSTSTSTLLNPPTPKLVHPRVVALCKRKFNIPQRTPEWYKAREDGLVTCSELGTVLGLNPYETREQLLKKKAGLVAPFRGNVATRWGQRWEDPAANEYEKRTGYKRVEFGLLKHPEIEWLAGLCCCCL
jgi:hypothetical protein